MARFLKSCALLLVAFMMLATGRPATAAFVDQLETDTAAFAPGANLPASKWQFFLDTTGTVAGLTRLTAATQDGYPGWNNGANPGNGSTPFFYDNNTGNPASLFGGALAGGPGNSVIYHPRYGVGDAPGVVSWTFGGASATAMNIDAAWYDIQAGGDSVGLQVYRNDFAPTSLVGSAAGVANSTGDNLSGTLNLAGVTVNPGDIFYFRWPYQGNTGSDGTAFTLKLSAVPEPSSVAIIAVTGASLLARRRR